MRTMLTALGARRSAIQNDQDSQKGFTLIELLVVVIIIGILAAIAIPVYLGIQDGAKDSAAKSDLTSNKTAVVAYYTEKGVTATAPTDATAAALLAPYGWVTSTGTTATLVGATGADKLCLSSKSASGKTFYVTANTAPSETVCTAP